MNQIAFLPAKVPEIIPAMISFMRDLRRQYCTMQMKGRVNYIELAASAHKRIIAIHPFNDGNDILARLVMNNLLMRGGHSPVFFPNSEEYVQKTTKGHTDNASFIQYLEECLTMTKDLKEELSLLSKLL